ncbi:MAG: GNAT family N-acetyltransferase [Phycisphaerales bacterium]|nr:GNAT family N-acetyltransferase [Phycisphaerales bacterium]
MESHRTGPETTRLILRAMTTDDAAAFYALNSHPDVMRLTGEPPLTSIEAAREAIATYPDFNTVGYGRWGCVLKDTGAMIGFCGLKYLDDLEEVDLGYRLLPEYWGRGLATEASLASVAFGFETLKLNRIIGLVLPENIGSIRVLEKVGMRAEGEFIYDGQRALRYVVER